MQKLCAEFNNILSRLRNWMDRFFMSNKKCWFLLEEYYTLDIWGSEILFASVCSDVGGNHLAMYITR